MKNEGIKALISGLAGAITLTTFHQILKKNVKDAPRVDILGGKTTEKYLKNLNINLGSKTVYNLSLAGDIIFNSVYYSMVASGKKPLINGSLLGLEAGAGVVSLPSLMNFSNEFSAKNLKQKALSFLEYLLGGLASAGIYKLFEKYGK